METLLDSPVWRWLTREDHAVYYRIFDSGCMVVRNGEHVGSVHVVPPIQLFSLVRSLHPGRIDDGMVEANLEIDSKRAYLLLTIEQARYPLFYWVPSNAPVWVREYLNGRNIFLEGQAVQQGRGMERVSRRRRDNARRDAGDRSSQGSRHNRSARTPRSKKTRAGV